MKKVKIVIATHKKYEMPKDNIYMPLQVGSIDKEEIGYKKDCVGDNISKLNPYFCELTGLYWAYKNLDVDYVGLAHYRRHFCVKSKAYIKKYGIFGSVLSGEEIRNIIKTTDIVLPKKRKYYIETLYSHYAHTLHVEPLDETRKIISDMYSNYLPSFDKVMKRRSAHMFNMFIMKKEYLDEYCKWLFDILFELQKRVDESKYDSFHARFYGRISELLLDVWLDKKKYSYKEIPVVSTEKINWWVKGTSFLKAKFGKKKYGKSF